MGKYSSWVEGCFLLEVRILRKQALQTRLPTTTGQPHSISHPGVVCPWTLVECLWEKMLQVTEHLSRHVTVDRTCTCPDSYQVLVSTDDTRLETWYLQSGQYFKTVGFMVAGVMKPCPNPTAVGQ